MRQYHESHIQMLNQQVTVIMEALLRQYTQNPVTSSNSLETVTDLNFSHTDQNTPYKVQGDEINEQKEIHILEYPENEERNSHL